MGVITVIVVLMVVAAAGAGFFYFYIQSLYREQKNYERGLKMVPVLIHLPPLSDDSDAGGRDARDMAEENISRAQVLYSILSSTFKKGMKNKVYGQRHVGFEVIASKGTVHFYAAVPVALLDVVEQSIVSAYPSARLEEVTEHNIFSPVGRITGTLGGELVLKESFVYPISTYKDIKRDSMQSLLNSLSKLSKEDGAGIQILFRPADNAWRKAAKKEAANKRGSGQNNGGLGGVFGGVGDVFGALNKAPEQKEAEQKPKKDVSALDQEVAEAIEEKTKHPGYETLIRVVASSNISHRSQSILNNIVATFSLFDAPGRNGFKFIPAKEIDSFVTAYILRFFPQNKSSNILNATELATLFHFPDSENIPTSQLERQSSKQVDAPRNIPEKGLLLGYNEFRGTRKPVRLSLTDRQRHMYVVGQTGTGKSTYLENLALQDMIEGRGFAFVDPHGDTAEKLLAMVPKERTEDVIYFSPADMDYPLGLNVFEFDSPDQKDFLIQESINMLYALYDPNRTGMIGARYEHLFRNAALAVMADPNGGTFVDIPKLFRDPNYVKQKLQYITDQNVLEFWQKEMPQSQRSSEFGDVVSWFVSKFGAFLNNEMMRNIIGQNKSSFNMRDIMDNQKILLVNLSRGRTGDLNSKLLGMIFVMKFSAAAMSRADIPEQERKDFCLYVDEFQNFSTDSFADILSQARKYRLNLIVANQFTTQLSDEIRDAVFGNVGTVACFRVGTNDAEFLSKQFAPVFDIDDLQFIPNYNAVVRMLIGGIPVQPFSMVSLPPLGHPNQELLRAMKQLSSAKYGRPKTLVEKEIFERMKTESPKAIGPSPVNNIQPPHPQATGQATRPMIPGGGAGVSSSFLDDWLAKRKASGIQSPNANLPPSTMPTAQPTNAFDPTGNAVKRTTDLPNFQKTPRTGSTEGTIKINRDNDVVKSTTSTDSQSMRVDKDGNLSVRP